VKKKGKKSLPTKMTLNLVVNEIPPHYYRNLIFATVVVALAILTFAKFAVYDRLVLVDEEWRQTDILRGQVEVLQNGNTSYYEVRERYDLYFTNNATKEAIVDAMEVLRIISQHMIPRAEVSSVTLAQNTLSVMLGGITLDDATLILLELYEKEPLVETVDIFTVTSVEGEEPVISMTVLLDPLGVQNNVE